MIKTGEIVDEWSVSDCWSGDYITEIHKMKDGTFRRISYNEEHGRDGSWTSVDVVEPKKKTVWRKC